MNVNLGLVCFECVIDHYLRTRIKRTGVSAECSLCESVRKCMSLKDLADSVEKILNTYICPTDSHNPRYNFHFEGDSLDYWVSEVFQCDNREKIVVAVCAELSKQNHFNHARFNNEDTYVRLPSMPIDVESAWLNFKSGMMHGNRYFNEDARKFLRWLFKGVDQQSTRKNAGFVQVLPPGGKSIYRARLCNSSNELDKILATPKAELSSPPKDRANSGRMNPVGVPAFYGAFERETCVAELRPPVGGKVISGEFIVKRSLRLLNFKVLEYTNFGSPSFFESGYQEKAARHEALSMLHQKISIPVLPGEEREYLVTQVIAEYLATQQSPRFDGVIFSSAQNKRGNNIVLFAHIMSTNPIQDEFGWVDLEPTPTEPGVELVPESLIVHEIEGVEFNIKSRVVVNGVLPPSDADHEEWGF